MCVHSAIYKMFHLTSLWENIFKILIFEVKYPGKDFSKRHQSLLLHIICFGTIVKYKIF
jgi:hypothetical protein